MTNEEIIERINSYIDCFEVCLHTKAEPAVLIMPKDYEAFKDVVKMLKKPQPTKWIPVSERLPEESFRSVIGWDRYRKCCVLVQYWRGEFQVAGTVASFDIVAWQPLPEPYKAESEGAE